MLPETKATDHCAYCQNTPETRARSPYNGCRFCRDGNSIGSIPEPSKSWSSDSIASAKKWIIEDLEKYHVGGASDWCNKRNINIGNIYENL